MLKLVMPKHFTKEMQLCEKRNLDMSKLYDVIKKLRENIALEAKHKNHPLKGKYSDYWECHIQNDWLLIYLKTETHLILHRTGTHSDLFK